MPSRLNPYIGFAGTARSAMEFYRDVFGGELVVNSYGDFGQGAPGQEDLLMHALLETPAGFTIMAADAVEDREQAIGTNISISLSGDDEADLRGYWDKLSAGGMVTLPLAMQVWGDTFGMCIDKFGIQWMVNITKPAE